MCKVCVRVWGDVVRIDDDRITRRFINFDFRELGRVWDLVCGVRRRVVGARCSSSRHKVPSP